MHCIHARTCPDPAAAALSEEILYSLPDPIAQRIGANVDYF